jgi:hypothetical protein
MKSTLFYRVKIVNLNLSITQVHETKMFGGRPVAVSHVPPQPDFGASKKGDRFTLAGIVFFARRIS